MNNRITVTEVTSTGSKNRMWLVKLDGREHGILTKFPNTRTDKHPWKAFLGVGTPQTFVGVSYVSQGAALSLLFKGVQL